MDSTKEDAMKELFYLSLYQNFQIFMNIYFINHKIKYNNYKLSEYLKILLNKEKIKSRYEIISKHWMYCVTIYTIYIYLYRKNV